MKSFHRRAERSAPAPRTLETPVINRHGLVRLDRLLTQKGLCASRTLAQRLIAAGKIKLDGATILKPSHETHDEAVIEILVDESDRFVSRGGLKLAGSLQQTGIDVQNLRCLDIGQSTGGFTDCLLQSGAKHVVGVDVGHGQLHSQLSSDPRVTVIEGINCRGLEPSMLGSALPANGFSLIVGDVSFISLTLILPQLPPLLAQNGSILMLVKPQFEVGPNNIGKGGIVRDTKLYLEVEQKIRTCAKSLNLNVQAWLESPITGGDGNHEFFIWLK